MKTFITFGQVHVHSVNGKTFDRDCIAAIESRSEAEGRELAYKYFDDKWHESYFGGAPPDDWLPFYPRGVIDV